MALSPLQKLRILLARFKLKKNKFTKTQTQFGLTTNTRQLDNTTPAATAMIGGVRLVFGLEWSPLNTSLDTEASLQEARNAGYNYGALMADGSLVGLARDLGPGKGKPYSAVLIMVEQLSSSEVEVFIFQIGEQVCFIGLVDRRPVTGFDLLLPSVDDAMPILADFRSMHVGHDIRILTNLGDVLPNSEQVRLDSLLSMLGPELLVKRLINRPLRRAVGMVALAVAILAGGTGWYLYEQEQERKRQEEAERIAHESDPNYVYEQSIASMMAGLGQPGNTLLDQWREMIAALPLTHGGWVLTTVECRAIGCNATWQRYHGSFRDFDRGMPPNTLELPELGKPEDSDILATTLVTHHQLPAPPVAAKHDLVKTTGIDRETLPLLRDAKSEWGSLLQDWSLLKVKGQLGRTVLFGPPGLTDPSLIHKPVVMMQWLVTDQIWSLPATELPAYVIPETLLVNLQDAKNSNYTLTGALYAKAKSF